MDSNKDEDAVAAFISDPTEEEDNSSGLSLHLPLPSAFLDFLKENGLDPSIYHAAATGNIKIPRYIRLKPGCESQLAEIEAELKCRLNKVDWLPGFFAIQSQIQIASTNAYRSGKIYGMDAASGAAVMALNISPGDHILDLCTAPGAKLCMISDILGNSGSLTGVDIAKHRLAACRTMLQKYALGDRCRLFVADGTTFSLLPLRSHTTATCSEDIKNIFIEWNSKRLWRDRKYARKAKHSTELQADPETTEPELIFYGKDSGVVGLHRSELYCAVDEVKYLISGYDKVLVDAECTHDGSFKHIQKFEYWGWKTLQRRVLDAKRTDNLMHLQGLTVCSAIIDGEKLLVAFGGYNGKYNNELFVLKPKATDSIQPRLFQSPAAAAAAASVTAAYALTTISEKNNDPVNAEGANLNLTQARSPPKVVAIDTDKLTSEKRFLESKVEEVTNENSSLKDSLDEMNNSHGLLLMELQSVQGQLAAEKSRCFKLEMQIVEIQKRLESFSSIEHELEVLQRQKLQVEQDMSVPQRQSSGGVW